ncbi:MAG: hypothetical protein V1775_09420 [Bacteroidota bacterium]
METDPYSHTPVLMLFLDFLMAMGLAFVLVPSIRAVARRWSLYDFDVGEEVTLSHIPRHGGIALVVAFGISVAVFSPEGLIPGVKFILAALLLLLAAGIQDDLLHLSWFMRTMVVVGAGAIITDVAGMPMFHTGLGQIFDYPLADFLMTYAIYSGIVFLLIVASKIPGWVSLILILNSAALAVIFLRSGFPDLAILPLSLAGASLTLFICSLGNYIFEGRASALAGGFMLAMLIIFSHNIGGELVVSYPALLVMFLTLLAIPVMMLTGVIKWQYNSIVISGKKINLYKLNLMILIVLLMALLLL